MRVRASALLVVASLFGGIAGCSQRANAPASGYLPSSQVSTQWFLYVGIQNAIDEKQFEVYPLGNRSPVREYGGTLGPVTMALDPWNDIYTTDDNPSGGLIAAYTPGGRSVLLEMAVYATRGLAFDAKGDLFATFYGYVAEYAPRSTKRIATIHSTGTANALAFDSSGNLYVARGTSASDSAVLVFPPGSKKPARTITNGLHWPVALLVDKSNDLYVANCAPCYAIPHHGGSVTEYAPGSETPLRTITDGIDAPAAIALGAKGLLYVANYGFFGKGSVTVYSSGTTPARKITDRIQNPDALAVAPNGNLYVANCAYSKGRDSVTAYTPEGRLVLRITEGINVCPLSIAIGKGN
jgi:sugar lactone lactonase YvrE